jgi:predicted nucleic acid-binding protein
LRRVFADTVYWLAVFLPGDAWADAAYGVDLSNTLLVTAEDVLSEFLTVVSGYGDYTRRLARRLVRGILNDAGVEVIVQSHESFLAGLSLYQRRPDKQYSLVDCTSMNAMRQKGSARSSRMIAIFHKKGFGGSWRIHSELMNVYRPVRDLPRSRYAIA